MFSFRRDQFQAILLGILIADALSHQHLTLGPPSPSLQNEKRQTLSPADPVMQSDRWCHAIAKSLNLLTVAIQERGSERVAKHLEENTVGQSDTAANNIVEAILCTVPLFLRSFECPDSIFMAELRQIPHAWQASVATFYQGATALLNDDILLATQAKMSLSQDSAAEIVTTAMEHVFLADGHFSLTLGQSLQGSQRLAGLPVLAGLLSACWIGRKGIPNPLYQSIKFPTVSLQNWLQRRWTIHGISTVDIWAEALWSQWLGQHSSHTLATDNDIYPAVQPAN